MKRVITVPNKEWFDENNARWEGDKRLWIIGYGMFELEDNNYPKFFGREDPMDYHFCPTWYEVDKNARITYIKDEIEMTKTRLEMLEAQLKETEEM